MAITIPPLPLAMRGNPEVERWYQQLVKNIPQGGTVTWASIDKTGSALSDLASRPHADLTSILEADPLSTDATRDKHVSNNDMKLAADHRAATNAHGATGAIVGTGDIATTATAGVVKQGAAVTDANNVGTTYSQTEVQNIVDTLNSLLASLRTAGVISP